jgi:ABC-2 type transport system ATP-binding protein
VITGGAIPATSSEAADTADQKGTPMAVIDIRGLTKRFGQVLAVDQLSFAVEGGTVTGFLGPNGAGKTTTLRMLLGLVQPTEGSATINGRPYRQLPDPSRQVGAALEAAEAHPGRTARNHLRVRATAGRIDRARVAEVLELVGLAEAADRRVGGLSLGMRQRLGLAAALLGDPEVLILDEPANGLDPEGVRWLRAFLRGLGREGRTVLVSSHLLAEVAQTADRVVVIDHGRLVTHAPLQQLMAGARQVVRVRSPRAQELHVTLLATGAQATLEGDRLEVTGASAEQIGLLAAQRSIPLFECVTDAADLEAVFLQLTAATPDHKDGHP